MGKLTGRRAGRYGRVTSWIIAQKVVLGVYWLADDEGLACHATDAEIAKASRVGVQSVARCIQEMEENGLITTIGNLGDRKRRTIVLVDHDRSRVFVDAALAAPGGDSYLLASAPRFSRNPKAQATGMAVWSAVRSLAVEGVCTATNAELARASGLKSTDTVKSFVSSLAWGGLVGRFDGPFGRARRALVLLDHPDADRLLTLFGAKRGQRQGLLAFEQDMHQ